MGLRDGTGISWTICKQSAPRSRLITTPTPHHSIVTGRVLFLMPNQQCESTYISPDHWMILSPGPILMIFLIIHTPMMSAGARAYNRGLGAEPPVGIQGAEPTRFLCVKD